jgi:hypothetical protein
MPEAAREPHDLFERFLLLTGRMNYMWTNTESLLIHVIAGLAGTTKETAVVIFLTLNTTRARIDLVERLAKMEGHGPEERDRVLAGTRELARLSGIRNRLNHCIYAFDAESGSAQTILMRIADRKTEIRMGQTEPIDTTEMERLTAALDDLAALNRSLWQMIARHGYPA